MDNEERQVDISITPKRSRRIARLGLFASGLGMLVGASVFLLGGAWSQSPADNAAAYDDGRSSRQVVITETQAAPTADSDQIRAGLLWVSAGLQPTPTFTPVPPTPVPTSPAEQGGYEPSAPPASNPQVSAPSVVAPPPAAGCPTAPMYGYGQALFNAINDARAQNGMGPLAADGCVTYVAQIRSDDMATRGYFAHESPDGSSAFSLLDAYGVPSGWAGENLARNNYPEDQTVAVAIRDLMASPPHRENILNPNYTAMGVAAALDGTGIYYYTMIFIGPP